MGDKHLFGEALASDGGGHGEGNSGKIAPALAIQSRKQQRDQPWTARLDAQPELTRQVIAEPGGAQLRNREPAGGHHQHGRMQLIPTEADDEMPRPRNLANPGSGDHADANPAALFLEHGENLLGRAIAEKLAQGLLVVGNGVSVRPAQ